MFQPYRAEQKQERNYLCGYRKMQTAEAFRTVFPLETFRHHPTEVKKIYIYSVLKPNKTSCNQYYLPPLVNT